MDTITIEQLIDAGACSEQLDLFQQLFGHSVTVTAYVAVKYADDFDFQWAGENLLSGTAEKIWAEHMAAIRKQRRGVAQQLYAERNKAVKRAQNDWARVYNAAWAEYREVFCAARLPVGQGTAARQSPRIAEALEKRDRVVIEADRVRSQAVNDVLTGYSRRMDEMWREFDETCARLFVKAYLSL